MSSAKWSTCPQCVKPPDSAWVQQCTRCAPMPISYFRRGKPALRAPLHNGRHGNYALTNLSLRFYPKQFILARSIYEIIETITTSPKESSIENCGNEYQES